MQSKTRTLWKEIINFLNHQPHPDHDFKTQSYKVELKDSDIYEVVVKRLFTSKGFVFLIGPWGSGKTTFIDQITSNEKKYLTFTKRSFFGVSNDLTAKFVVFTLFERLCITAAATSILISLYPTIVEFSKLSPPISLVLQATGILALLLLADFQRLLYLSCHIIAGLFQFIAYIIENDRYKKVLVIEDLDRSSLTIQQQFGFLSNLPVLGKTILVPIGYNTDEERIEALQYAHKLSPDVIELPTNKDYVYIIIKTYFPEFPFTQPGHWMEILSVRDILSICYACSRASDGSIVRLKRNILIAVKQKLSKLATPEGRHYSDFDFRFEARQLNLKPIHSITLNSHENSILSSFGTSADAMYFCDTLMQIAEPNEKQSSNWVEVLVERFFKESNSEELIRRFEKEIANTVQQN